MIKNESENITYLYNASGLVTEVKRENQTMVKFFYNDRGHRVRKEFYNPLDGTLRYIDHYVRDASGNAIAIYRNQQLEEYTIFGAGRLGVYKSHGARYYQLTDHLGNVRGVVGRNEAGEVINDLDIATDYYPFGMPMPGRNLQGDYRYAYQGQEKDTETGKEAFQLRLWDSRIGRWLTTDPYGQFNSPYLGMGNNPISVIDPDGGFACIDADGNSFPCPDTHASYDSVAGTMDAFFNADGSFAGDALRLETVFLSGSGGNQTSGNLALSGNILGGISGRIGEHEIFKFFNSAPDGKYAVKHKGALKYWTNKWGGNGSISKGFIGSAKQFSNSVKTVSKAAGYASFTGSVLGYYGAAENAYNGDYAGAGIEGAGNTVSWLISAGKIGKSGNLGGLAWTFGWEAGRAITNTEIYNRTFFGVHSQIYLQRGIENGFIKSVIEN